MRIHNETLGSVVTLRGPRDGTCYVYQPDGVHDHIIRAPKGRVQFTVDQEGEWRYQWEDTNTEGTINVVQGLAGTRPPSAEQVASFAEQTPELGRLEIG